MSTQERKKIEKENRRNVILASAESIMAKNGLHGLNLDLIAQETNLAKGTLYLYFKSKEEILSILTIKARKLLLEEFKKIAVNDQPYIEKLKSIVKINYNFYKKYPLYYDLVSLYEANHQVTETEEMYESSIAINDLVINIIQKAKEADQVQENINVAIFTLCLWGSTVGILQLMKVRGPIMKEKMNISENQILDTFIQMIFKGIQK